MKREGLGKWKGGRAGQGERGLEQLVTARRLVLVRLRNGADARRSHITVLPRTEKGTGDNETGDPVILIKEWGVCESVG